MTDYTILSGYFFLGVVCYYGCYYLILGIMILDSCFRKDDDDD